MRIEGQEVTGVGHDAKVVGKVLVMGIASIFGVVVYFAIGFLIMMLAIGFGISGMNG